MIIIQSKVLAVNLMVHLIVVACSILTNGSRTATTSFVTDASEQGHEQEMDGLQVSTSTPRPWPSSISAAIRRRPPATGRPSTSGLAAPSRSANQEQIDPQYQEPESVPVNPGGGVTSTWRTWLNGLKNVFPQFSSRITDTFMRMFSMFFGSAVAGGAGGAADFGIARIIEFKRNLISQLIGVTRGGMLKRGSVRAVPGSSSSARTRPPSASVPLPVKRGSNNGQHGTTSTTRGPRR